MKLLDLLEESPIIAAVKDDEGLAGCLKTDCQVIFVLYGNVLTVSRIVDTIKTHGKYAMVHVDLIQGLSSKEIAVDFLKENTRADGIISTKPVMVKRAIELGLIGIQRAFVIDSMAMSTTKKQIESFCPDAIEIMPGIMPSVIREMKAGVKIPVIAGGLLSAKADIIAACSAGADAVSTTKEELWFV